MNQLVNELYNYNFGQLNGVTMFRYGTDVNVMALRVNIAKVLAEKGLKCHVYQNNSDYKNECTICVTHYTLGRLSRSNLYKSNDLVHDFCFKNTKVTTQNSSVYKGLISFYNYILKI